MKKTLHGQMSVRRSSSASPAVAGSTVNVESANEVYIARHITERNIFQGNGNTGLDTDDDDLEEDCGCDTSTGSLACRWTQTVPFICMGYNKNYLISDNYTQINMRFDEEAAKIITGGGSLQQMQDAVLKTLVRLEWNGQEIHSKAMTAWKLTMKEDLDRLYKDVIKCIQEGSDRRKLYRMVKEAFEKFGMQFLGLDRSSLIFIFQHVTDEGAEEVRASKQEAVQQLLMEFLPSWVKEKEVSWKVMLCERSSVDRDWEGQLSEPIPLRCSKSGSVPSVDYRHLERTIEEKLDSSMQAVYRHITKTQEEFFQKQTYILTALMKTFLTECTSQDNSAVCVGSEAKDEHAEVGPDISLKDSKPVTSVKDPPGQKNSGTMSGNSEALIQRIVKEKFSSGEGGLPSERGVPKQTVKQRQYQTPALAAPAMNWPRDNRGRSSGNNASQQTTGQDRGQTGKGEEEPWSDSETTRMSQTPSGATGTSLKRRQVAAMAAFVSAEHQMQNTLPGVDPVLAEKSIPPDSVSRRSGQNRDDRTDSKTGEDWSPDGKRVSLEGLEAAGMSWDLGDITSPKELARDFDAKDIKRNRRSERVDAAGKGELSDSEGTTTSAETKQTPKESQQSKLAQAEQLLDWVNVKTHASQSSDPEIQRLMDQVALALQDEEKESPRARALDTVLVLDTSDSVVNSHLDELKTVTHTFIDGIEDNVDSMNLEENLAVVQMGSRAWVRQHLTNDYIRVRDAVDIMTPGSKRAPTGGKTAMFQALLVCLGAIEGKGGAVTVAGCHRVRPRLVFFTDGRATDEGLEFGADTQSNVNEVKFSLVQLISECASKKHKTTPAPIFWVPIGNNPDRPFMESLAALSGGKVVEKENVEELCRYYKMQETIGCVYKMVRKHKDIYETEQQIRSIVNALAGNLTESEKDYVIEEVKMKMKDPENDAGEADDFDNVFEDTELVSAGMLLPLGTRVIRGSDWKWSDQDSGGPGTVIQHRKKQDGWLHIMWDNGSHNAYRYGDCMDVMPTDSHPRILDGSELIQIGVQVKRGDDWKSGDEDGNGTGVVIRKRKDNKIKVRWENGFIGKYKYGADGKMEVTVVTEGVPQTQAGDTEQGTAALSGEDSDQGAVGGYDPAGGPLRRVWQWWDPLRKDWRTYDAETQDKLLQAYQLRQDGSCVIIREGFSRRVSFKLNQEKAVDKGKGTVYVQSRIVSEVQYQKMLQEQEEVFFEVD